MDYEVEEPTNEEVEVPVKEEGQEPEEKQGEVETVAAELGWRPDGELDAKDYILKSKDIQDTMRTHIKDQKSQLSGLGSAVKELKVHNEQVYKAEVRQLKGELSTLKAKKKEAIEEGDVEAVDKIDGEIDGVKEAMVKPESAEPENPEYKDWVKDNQWYERDEEMKEFVNTIVADNPGVSFQRITVLVDKKVRDMFPDKFEGKAKLKASPVEGSSRKIASSRFTESDLTSGQKSIMRQFVQQGIMTKKEYIADIQKTQEA